MNTLSVLASLLLFFTIQNCNADLVHDLIGRWTGIEKTTLDGVKTRWSVTTVYERFQEDGMVIKSTVKSSGKPTSKRILRCYKSGKVEGAYTKGWQTSGLVEGTWKATGGNLTINVKVSNLSGSYKQTTKLFLINHRKTSGIITDSKGMRGVATMSKE